MMKAVNSSEPSFRFYWSTRRKIPEDTHCQSFSELLAAKPQKSINSKHLIIQHLSN